jgi:hypothetical protein
VVISFLLFVEFCVAWGSVFYEVTVVARWKYKVAEYRGTGDFRYTRFRYPRFRISAVLFQCHEEHQYPIRGHGRSCRADSLSCARSFTDSPHHFDFGNYKSKPLMLHHSENARAYYTFPILRVFDIRDDSQERNPRV